MIIKMFSLHFQGLLLTALVKCSVALSSEWSFYSYLGDSLELVCDDLSTNITFSEHGLWALPSGEPVTADDHHYQVVARLTISGYALKVSNITEKMSGVYICTIVQADGSVRTRVLRGLNISGPKFRHWTDKYTTNFIRGVIAASCLLVPMLTFCFVQKFRYRTDAEVAIGNGFPRATTAYKNEGFEMKNDVDNLDTRM